MGSYMYRTPPNKLVILLPMLANELLNEVATYLPCNDQLSMARTCWTFHGAATRLMYRRVTISDLRARRFFKTVSESDKNYGQYVRDLRYFVTSSSDVMLTYFLLCDAIPHMKLLQNLTLSARPSHSDRLVHMLAKRSIVSTSTNTSCEHNTASTSASLRSLANLQTLNLHGAIELISLVRSRNLTSICITDSMNSTVLSTFIDAVTNGTSRNCIIRSLVLSLKYSLGSRIASPMRTLGSSFPNLETLIIRTLRANALEASNILSSTAIFPELKTFHLNDWTILRPVFILPQDSAIAQQRTHVEAAAVIRQNLESINFGTVHWNRHSICNEWTMSEDSNTDEEEEDTADFNNECPIFWDVTYSTPRPLVSVEKDDVN